MLYGNFVVLDGILHQHLQGEGDHHPVEVQFQLVFYLQVIAEPDFFAGKYNPQGI